MLVSSQLSNIPVSSTNLADSSTGIGAVSSLDGIANVQGRLSAIIAGDVSDDFRAAALSSNVSIVVNTTAISASIATVSTTWHASSGANGSFSVMAVVAGPVPGAHGPTKNLGWIAGPILGEFTYPVFLFHPVEIRPHLYCACCNTKNMNAYAYAYIYITAPLHSPLLLYHVHVNLHTSPFHSPFALFLLKHIYTRTRIRVHTRARATDSARKNLYALLILIFIKNNITLINYHITITISLLFVRYVFSSDLPGGLAVYVLVMYFWIVFVARKTRRRESNELVPVVAVNDEAHAHDHAGTVAVNVSA